MRIDSQPPAPFKPRTCWECSAIFTPATRRHQNQRFCTPAHQAHFFDVMAQRGKVLLPFALVSRAGKSGYGDVHKYALREYNALCDRFNAEDRAAGRQPLLLVKRKARDMWSAADLDLRRKAREPRDEDKPADTPVAAPRKPPALAASR